MYSIILDACAQVESYQMKARDRYRMKIDKQKKTFPDSKTHTLRDRHKPWLCCVKSPSLSIYELVLFRSIFFGVFGMVMVYIDISWIPLRPLKFHTVHVNFSAFINVWKITLWLSTQPTPTKNISAEYLMIWMSNTLNHLEGDFLMYSLRKRNSKISHFHFDTVIVSNFLM